MLHATMTWVLDTQAKHVLMSRPAAGYALQKVSGDQVANILYLRPPSWSTFRARVEFDIYVQQSASLPDLLRCQAQVEELAVQDDSC